MPELLRPDGCRADVWAAIWAQERRRVEEVHRWLTLTERSPLQYGTVDRAGVYHCRFDEYLECGRRVVGWQGRMRPFGASLTEDEIWRLIADLDAPTQPRIGIYKDGSLGHLEDCGVDHAALREDVRRALTPLPLLDDAFLVEIVYRKAPAYPLVRALEPRITVVEYPDMPHLLTDVGALCVAFPPDIRWTLDGIGVSVFADDAVTFLTRHVLWRHLRGKVSQPWLGVYASHRAGDLLQTPPTDPCPCGSGRRFRDCCTAKIRRAADLERRAQLHGLAAPELEWLEQELREI